MRPNPLTASGHYRADPVATLQVDCEQAPARWASLQHDWRHLTSGLQPRSPFMHWEWLSAWHRHFGTEHPLTVFVCRQGGQCTGILPLVTHVRRARKLQLRTLRLLGTGLSDQLGLMLRPADAGALARAVREQCSHWDILELKDVEANDPVILKFCRALADAGLPPDITPEHQRPYLVIDENWGSYYDRVIGRKTRRRNRIQLRKLRTLGKLSFETVTSPAGYLHHLDRIRQIREQHFNTGQKRQRPFDTAAGHAFFIEAGQSLAEQSMLALHLLKLDDKIIAYDLGLRHRHRYLQYFGGYDCDYARYSPGRLLQVYLLRWCFEHNFAEVDFGRGNHEWKQKWTRQTRKNVRITVYAPTLMSRIRRAVLMR